MEVWGDNIKWPKMPYPGLRPFEISANQDESLIFFGRDKQIFELVDRLAQSHLVAVLGPSGCGKSSLVRVGLIPALENGYLYQAGSRWLATSMEPGSKPLRALALALGTALNEGQAPSPVTFAHLEERLNGRPDALVAISEEAAPKLGERTNLLIVVDQFEELFREDLNSPAETTKLINLILNVFHAQPDNLFIVLTMRTDYLEQCAYYKGLPEALNQTQYLTPRLNEEELREAIEKPIQRPPFAGAVDPALVRRLVRQLSDEDTYDPDDLPLMQHALMWFWTREKPEQKSEGEPRQIVLHPPDDTPYLDLAGILSEHANSIYRSLTSEGQRIAQIMFKLMSRSNPVGHITRRVTSPQEIADVAGVSPDAVDLVVTAFMSDASSFIRWKNNQTGLDVTHESLIRRWDRLNGTWLREETAAAEMYRSLEKKAQAWKGKEDFLLTGPDLQVALAWQKEKRPTPAWARRYGSDLQLVVNYMRVGHKSSGFEKGLQADAQIQPMFETIPKDELIDQHRAQ